MELINLHEKHRKEINETISLKRKFHELDLQITERRSMALCGDLINFSDSEPIEDVNTEMKPTTDLSTFQMHTPDSVSGVMPYFIYVRQYQLAKIKFHTYVH